MREQPIPCDSSIQLEDVSNELAPADAATFRSLVGMCLYFSRERPDINQGSFWEDVSSNSDELAALEKADWISEKVRRPWNPIEVPRAWKREVENVFGESWILESYSDADWASNKVHRKSTSCGVQMLNGRFPVSSSRAQLNEGFLYHLACQSSTFSFRP